jgi:hypothetical protein
MNNEQDKDYLPLQIKFYQNFKLLYFKEHYQEIKKTTHKIRENICRHIFDKGLVF